MHVFAEEISGTYEAEYNSILSSFYFMSEPDSATTRFNQPSFSDPYSITEKGTVMNTSSLFEMHHTTAIDSDDILLMCNEILDGNKLGEYIESMNILYGISKDIEGQDNGYVEYRLNDKTSSYEMIGYGEITEESRMDLRITPKLSTQLSRSKLQIPNTKATFCIINNFATGIIFTDNSEEYFMPVVDTINSFGYVEANKIYTTKEIAEIIINNSDTIFSPRAVSNGNPEMGGTSGTINPNTGNNSFNFLIVMGLATLIGGVICLVSIFKEKHKAK